ncbi:hypothetical protein M431DRAFT_540054, partial [Trichoderma harzianum CBS 226.95]
IGAFRGRHRRFKACIGAEVHNGFSDLALHPLNAMRLEYSFTLKAIGCPSRQDSESGRTAIISLSVYSPSSPTRRISRAVQFIPSTAFRI